MKWANPKIESKNIEFGVNASGNIMHTLCKLENNISCTPTQYGDNNKRRQYSLRKKNWIRVYHSGGNRKSILDYL